MQFTFPAKEVEACDQSHKAKIMVAVQMGDEDVFDLLQTEMIPSQLDLCAFSTIKQEKLFMHIHQLGAGIAMREGDGSSAAQNAYRESHIAR